MDPEVKNPRYPLKERNRSANQSLLFVEVIEY
jgi:hypothetical protein